jgi:hypothetical protein
VKTTTAPQSGRTTQADTVSFGMEAALRASQSSSDAGPAVDSVGTSGREESTAPS